MADWARSDDARVQAQLDRLNTMAIGKDTLGLSRLRRLLAKLGNPEANLPPTFHIAGTNGKGSTCTYLRTAIAAAGMTVHVYTSPHLVQLNERIRVANRLIDDATLAEILKEVLDATADDQTTFFEATTAAAFLAFARTTADACIIEVGIGGRLDATNVLPRAAACGIAQLGIDHQVYLGETIEQIAAEKAGIAKATTPLVTQFYSEKVIQVITSVAEKLGAPVSTQNTAWCVSQEDEMLAYKDRDGELRLPLPVLVGTHQLANAGLAIALLRHQSLVRVGETALAEAMRGAKWPARLSPLDAGPVADLLPADAEIWLDGAHNTAAIEAIITYFGPRLAQGQHLEIVIALLNDKDLDGIIRCLATLRCRIHAVPIVGYDCRPARQIQACAEKHGLSATAHTSFTEALRAIAQMACDDAAPIVLITGSLYLAGQVLKANLEFPD